MTIDQAKVVGTVLKRFTESELLEWTDVDDYMVFLSWLDQAQLIIETRVLLDKHKQTDARCEINHSPDECFVPMVLDAISYILEDYESTKRLAKKARYVLEYYLALTQAGEIISD